MAKYSFLDRSIADAEGLAAEDAARLETLVEEFSLHREANAKKRQYYEGHIPLREVNLGLALPKDLAGLEIGCSWGEKCVDVLAARSRLDGFVGSGGQSVGALDRIARANRLTAEYAKAAKDELKYGCTFATLSADEQIGCRIRFHSPESAAALWDGEKGRIGSGMAIIETEGVTGKRWRASLVNLYTDTAVVVLRRKPGDAGWIAEYHPNDVGRVLMEPLVWNATARKPFGRSRLKEPVRRLIQGYVRTICNATIGLEFSTSPQKYLLGITDEQYDAVVNEKFRTYVGSMLAATKNPETGENPVFGQLSQGTIEPHVQMMRLLSTQFSAATGLSVTDVGVVNDANPTSSDAIEAQTKTLTLLAEQLNEANADALYQIAVMAQALAAHKPIAALTPDELDVIARFKNPTMSSLAAQADAAMKIASSRPGFAQTDVFMEMVGFDQAEIRRIKAQEARARGLAVLQELTDEEAADDDDLAI